MDIKVLDNIDQFKQLKKGDRLLIRWDDYFIKHNKGVRSIMLYEISKVSGNEVICQSRNNHYFNYNLYLEKKSMALEVYKVQ